MAELLNQAIAQHQAGQLAAAKGLYKRVLSQEPRNPLVPYLLGAIFQAEGALAEASRFYNRALQLGNRDPQLWNNLGAIYHLQGNYSQAQKCYQEALKASPGFAQGWFNLGTLFHDAKENSQAIECYNKSLALNPQNPLAWFNLGNALEGEAAIACYEKCLALDPQDKSGAAAKLAFLKGEVSNAHSLAAIKAKYEPLAQLWDKDKSQTHGYGGLLLFKGLLEGLPFGLQVLDLGCGTGLSGQVLKPWAKFLTGVDLSPNMLAQAEKKGVYDRLQVGEILDFLGINREKYDLITAAAVLVHFGDLAPVFKAVKGALNAGGSFAFTLFAKEGEGFDLGENLFYRHSRRYIEEVLSTEGFRLELLSEGVHEYIEQTPVKAWGCRAIHE